MTMNRQWLLHERPVGMIGPEHFKYVETDIPEPGEGEVLIRNLVFSFDPTQRGWTMDRESYLPPVQIGEPMRAGCVAQVVKSNHADFSTGQMVQATNGWQDYAVVDPAHPPSSLRSMPEGAPPEMMLSVLGVTGLTAYFGLLDLGDPQPGETVLVSGAAGATGSVAGQIAKIRGCRVVGIAGGPKKCAWLTNEAGFDHAIDYKLGSLDQQIADACPEKWNVFFDNVGGDTLEAALNHLNMRSRVVMCVGIANYNATTPQPGPTNIMNLVIMRSRMEGFIVLDYLPRAGEAIKDLLGWIGEGKLKYQIDMQEGFENIPKTLQRLFTGKNLGKQLLKVADPD